MGNIQQNIAVYEKREAPQFTKTLLALLLFTMTLGIFSACAPGTNLLGSGSWQASTLTKQHVHALTVDPNKPQILYAGDENGTIFNSSDAGLHWTKRGQVSASSLTLSMLTMSPAGAILYALTNLGLFASSDAAQTWQMVNTSRSGLPDDSYTSLIFDEQKDMYLGTLQHGVFMSNGDNDTDWKAINGTLPSKIAINELAFDSTQHRLWAATSLGIYTSDNVGTTWTALNNGLPIADGATSVQPAASVGGATGLVYAGTKHGIFRSMDNGTHWSESGQVLQGVPIQHILIDFRSANASTLYVGTKFGAFRSDDSGQNWSGIASGFPANTSVYALVIGADKASRLYAAANNVYLYPGSDSGVNPTRIITLFLILLLFVLLGLIAQRSTKRRKAFLSPKVAASATKEN